MRDELLPDNCMGQEFADKVNTLIRDHNPYIQMPCVGARLGRLIIKFLPDALASEGRALLRELIDTKVLGNENKVIEETVRLVEMAHSSVLVSAAAKGMGKKDKRAIAAAAPTRFKGKQGNTQPSGGAPYELLNGQWCSKGTCHFNPRCHIKVNPGGPSMLSGSALARTSAREGPQEQTTSGAHQERARQKREAPPGSKPADLCGTRRREWWGGSD
eukprot:6016357-Pleurochrysis_carterae.AAC.1